MGDDRIQGAGDVAEVGLEVFVERSGDAEDDGVAVLDAGEIRGGVEFAGGAGVGDLSGGNVLDVAGAGAEVVDFRGVDIEAERLVARASVGEDEWQTDIAETDDANDGLFLLDAIGGGHGVDAETLRG